MLSALNKSEVDVQIATAKRYPRNLDEVRNKIKTYASNDQETAEDCFYVLRRKGVRGEDSVIEGLSVRMAEIIAGAWGNLRVATRIIGNDGKMITAQAVCHDLETNVAVSKEVKRRITGRDGKPYSEDMQVVTGNAAASIAFRNAVLAVIPKAVTKRVVEEVRKVALGQSIDLETSRQNIIAYFNKLGVTREQLFFFLDINTVEEIDQRMVYELRSAANAIKEGDTTVEDCFFKPYQQAQLQKEAEAKKETAEGKAAAAIQAATNGDLFGVDTETGEIKETKQKKQSK